jgi:hypothetical protein
VKKGWLITFFVAFFCICALNFNNLAYAQINQSSSNTENEIGFKNQTSVEVLDILQRVPKYSEASQQEIEIVCNYYGVDGNVFKDLEAKGYEVSVVEYISPLETPKNLMIRAFKTKDENDKAMDEYIKLMSSLNVYPALYAYLNSY